MSAPSPRGVQASLFSKSSLGGGAKQKPLNHAHDALSAPTASLSDMRTLSIRLCAPHAKRPIPASAAPPRRCQPLPPPTAAHPRNKEHTADITSYDKTHLLASLLETQLFANCHQRARDQEKKKKKKKKKTKDQIKTHGLVKGEAQVKNALEDVDTDVEMIKEKREHDGCASAHAQTDAQADATKDKMEYVNSLSEAKLFGGWGEGKGDNVNWVSRLLETRFYGRCDNHDAVRKNERNVFCTMHGIKICTYCERESHAGCQCLHVSRYMYHDVLLAKEAARLLDVGEVQSYLNNGNRVVYIDRRGQHKSKLGVNCKKCEWCSRTLQEGYRFCCVFCRLSFGGQVFEGQQVAVGGGLVSGGRKKSETKGKGGDGVDGVDGVVAGRIAKRKFSRKGRAERSPGKHLGFIELVRSDCWGGGGGGGGR